MCCRNSWSILGPCEVQTLPESQELAASGIVHDFLLRIQHKHSWLSALVDTRPKDSGLQAGDPAGLNEFACPVHESHHPALTMGAPHGMNPEACVLQYYINSSISPAASMALHSAWLDQMEAGLAHEVDTTLLMLPSFIRELPTGTEVGSYLAIDVGGTSLRLLHVVLSKDRSQIVRSLAEHRAATHRNKVRYLQSQVQFIRLAIKAQRMLHTAVCTFFRSKRILYTGGLHSCSILAAHA